MNGQTGRIHGSAAGSHQAAGAVAFGVNIRIFNIDGCAAAVAEHGVGMGSVCFNHQIAQIKGCLIMRVYGRVFTIEVRLIAGAFTCFRNQGIAQGDCLSVCLKHMSAILAVFNRLIRFNIIFSQI